MGLARKKKEVSSKSKKTPQKGNVKKKAPAAKKPKRLSAKKREEVILEHQEYSQKLAWSFLNAWRVKLNPDDVKSIAYLALCETALRFDPDRQVAFKTFFFYHLRGMLVKEIVNLVNQKRICEPILQTANFKSGRNDLLTDSVWPFPLVEHKTPEHLIRKKEVANICWTACSMLDVLEQEVVLRHFVKEHSLKKIARDLQYCRCHISRVKSRAMGKLKKYLAGDDVEEVVSGDVYEEAQNHSRRNYTGGRGRRKNAAQLERSPLLEKLLECA